MYGQHVFSPISAPIANGATVWGAAEATVDDVDLARAGVYCILSRLLMDVPNAGLGDAIAAIASEGTRFGAELAALARDIAEVDEVAVEREYFDLFIGLGQGELLPYASYYLTGFLNERPLAALRSDLAGLGLERCEGQSEPEDHAGVLCEIMAGMAAGPFRRSVEDQRVFFERHLLPWIGRFFVDLELSQSARLYRGVGTLGRILIETEEVAFSLPEAGGSPKKEG